MEVILVRYFGALNPIRVFKQYLRIDPGERINEIASKFLNHRTQHVWIWIADEWFNSWICNLFEGLKRYLLEKLT